MKSSTILFEENKKSCKRELTRIYRNKILFFDPELTRLSALISLDFKLCNMQTKVWMLEWLKFLQGWRWIFSYVYHKQKIVIFSNIYNAFRCLFFWLKIFNNFVFICKNCTFDSQPILSQNFVQLLKMMEYRMAFEYCKYFHCKINIKYY